MKKPTLPQMGVLLALSLPPVLVLLCSLGAGWAYYSLVFRHQQAFQQWETSKPSHYQYSLSFKGDLTYQDFLVEVSGGNLVHLTDMNTGVGTSIPGSASTSFLPTNAWIRGNLLIDDLFIRIRTATQSPRSLKEFYSRSNPAFYTRLSAAGWVRPGLVTCVPAYPQVEYHPVYGYPEKLRLGGSPCSPMVEDKTPVRVQIKGFQPLP